MIKKILALGAITVTTAFASPSAITHDNAMLSLQRCGKILDLHDDFVMGGLNRIDVLDRSKLESFSLYLGATAVASVRTGDNYWVLTSSGLELWGLQTRSLKLYRTLNELGVKSPVSIHSFNNKLFIGTKRDGLKAFSLDNELAPLKTIALDYGQGELKSGLVSMKSQGKWAIGYADALTLRRPWDKQAFTGLVIFDLEKMSFVKKVAGPGIGARGLAWNQNRLIVSYSPFLYAYNTKLVLDPKLKNSVSYERRWLNLHETGYFTGDPVLNGDKLYSCITFGRGPAMNQRAVMSFDL